MCSHKRVKRKRLKIGFGLRSFHGFDDILLICLLINFCGIALWKITSYMGENEGSVLCHRRLRWLTTLTARLLLYSTMAVQCWKNDFKWPRCMCSFKHLPQRDQVHMQLTAPAMSALPHIAFSKSPGKCSYVEMYTMCWRLLWRTNEDSKVSLIWNT